MVHTQEASSPFTGFGTVTVPKSPAADSVFILAVYRDGHLTAAAHSSERGAMAAAADLLDDGGDEEYEEGTLEDYYARGQRLIADEGGVMEIIPSPVFGG